MSAFTYPARFTAGSDGRILVEFVDLPRVSTDGKDDHEAMEEAIDALGWDLSIRLSRRDPGTFRRQAQRTCTRDREHCGVLRVLRMRASRASGKARKKFPAANPAGTVGHHCCNLGPC